MAESRPVALPPGERTVGQLVAETIRLYSSRFWAFVPLGLAFAGVDVASLGRSVAIQTIVLWAFAPVFCVAYVRASGLVLGARGSWSAFLVALLLYLPFPVLLRLYVLPGIAWFGLFGLAVPAAVAEKLAVRPALRRGLELGRADPAHSIGGLATLALVYGVSRYALLILLHTQGDQTQHVAVILADLILSPMLFVGAAMLYVDQAARTR